MSQEQTLGEAIAACLNRGAPEPEPIEWDYDCARYLVACAFVIEFCQHFAGCEFDAVWQELNFVSDDKLEWLESPLGWSCLAAHVSGLFGITGEIMKPTIN